MHDSAVDIVHLNSNGQADADSGEASQSALPFSQLYMTFDHGACRKPCCESYSLPCGQNITRQKQVHM